MASTTSESFLKPLGRDEFLHREFPAEKPGHVVRRSVHRQLPRGDKLSNRGLDRGPQRRVAILIEWTWHRKSRRSWGAVGMHPRQWLPPAGISPGQIARQSSAPI